MTDLHTHILPYIDDGAENETESLSMLLRQQQQGIRNIALTSHFDCETVTVDEFLAQLRQLGFEEKSFSILNFGVLSDE